MSPTPLFSLCFEIFIKCVLRIHRMCFDHVTLFQLLPDPPLPFWSTQLCVFFSFKSIKQSLCCPHILECVAIHQGRVNLPGAKTLKKTDSSSPWSYQLFLSHGWAVVHTFPLHVGSWSILSFHGSCLCCHNCCWFICVTAVLCPEDPVSQWSPTATVSYYFSVPSSQ